MRMVAVRRVCLALFAIIIFPSIAAASINMKSGKYAALVIDADTGEILYARNADKKRYPASLTKMMTLYMVFDALNKGELKLNQRLPVSKHAASQPQTNISLKQGETIPVKDAIKSLVVRSANDASVVLAEAIGDTEWGFARLMTAKARSLGMRSTNFRNAHGLPDKKQYTTARDMAKLSAALRRDFPQYYHYFKTTKFSWKGRHYKSHNRVLGKFDGVDGIKTGYIRMSGFNLATSVKRDGYHIVAIVMGGQTGKIRDGHMMTLLDKTFTVLAERKDQPRLFANAPTPVAKPDLKAVKDVNPVPAFIRQAKSLQAKESRGEVDTASLNVSGTSIVPVKKPTIERAKSKVIQASLSPSKPGTLQYQMANLSKRALMGGGWGIQVGAFSDENSAVKAAANAVKMARDQLKDSHISVTGKGSTSTSIHRARLANLTEYQAKSACKTLLANNAQCFVYRSGQQRDL